MHFHRNETMERVKNKMYDFGIIQNSLEILNFMIVVENHVSQKIKWKECFKTQRKYTEDNYTGKDWKTYLRDTTGKLWKF